jgi:hypothetical protein
MQTFLPYPSFTLSAQTLDRQRLGKQRVEVLQILTALSGKSKGWVNHPATRMWRDHEPALIEYGLAMCDEWVRRGYYDGCRSKIEAFYEQFDAAPTMPWWFGDGDFHRAHRSNLLRKDPTYYGQFDWGVPSILPYLWPHDDGTYSTGTPVDDDATAAA